MKLRNIVITLLLAVAAIVVAQDAPKEEAPDPVPKREVNISVNSTVDKNSDKVRVTVSELMLDLNATLNVELWNSSGSVIDRIVVKMTPAEVKQWATAEDPAAWVGAFALSKVGLTAK